MTSLRKLAKERTKTAQPIQTAQPKSKSPVKQKLEQTIYFQWFDTRMAVPDAGPTQTLALGTHTEIFATLLLKKLPKPTLFTVDIRDIFAKTFAITITCTGTEKELEDAVRILSVEDNYILDTRYLLIIWLFPLSEQQALLTQSNTKRFESVTLPWTAELQPRNPLSQSEVAVSIDFLDTLGWSYFLPSLFKINQHIADKPVRILHVDQAPNKTITFRIMYVGENTLVAHATRAITQAHYSTSVVEAAVFSAVNGIYTSPVIRSAHITVSYNDTPPITP